MSKLRVSIVQYLNTAPLVRGLTHGPLRGKYELSFTMPSHCAEELRSGAADIAIIPVIEYQRIDGLAVLPGLSIASKKRARSLLIVAKKPIEQARRIALDRSSRSTQALTRILCAEQWKIAPEFSEAPPDLSAMLEPADAALLIGDPALRVSLAIERDNLGTREGSTICHGATLGITSAEILYVYDVVTEWRRLTGLSAVLAVWAAKREVVTTDVAGDFMASRDFGLARITEICAEAGRELELPIAALETYLRENIDYTLDAENRRGLERYFHEAAKLGLIANNRTIEWAAAPSLAAQVSSTSTLG